MRCERKLLDGALWEARTDRVIWNIYYVLKARGPILQAHKLAQQRKELLFNYKV